MIDAVLHVLDCLGPSRISIWTWTVADYEVDVFSRLRTDGRLTGGLLVVDVAARGHNAGIIADWRAGFGAESVRYVRNHAKIATVEGGGRKVLLRGSMNLNFNPRFEQLDVTVDGPDFELVRRLELELPADLADERTSNARAISASKLTDAFDPATLAVFSKVKTWAK